jgi:hypothetical protein
VGIGNWELGGGWGSGKWEVGSGEVGKWGSGEVGKWGSGEMGKLSHHPITPKPFTLSPPVSRLLIKAKSLKSLK